MKEMDTYQDMEVHAWMPHNTKKQNKNKQQTNKITHIHKIQLHKCNKTKDYPLQQQLQDNFWRVSNIWKCVHIEMSFVKKQSSQE